MSLGLFGTLGIGARALQTQQQGIEIAGHNLANATNPAYSRQRLLIQAAPYVPGDIGPQGTGVEAIAIEQIRNLQVDMQYQVALSDSAFWRSQQQALQYVQAALGQQIDLRSDSTGATSATAGITATGLASALSELFAAFQSLSTNPTSMAERQVLLQKAANLASQFNQISARLDTVRNGLNDVIQAEVGIANELLGQIAELNDQITAAEIGGSGIANDLRDARQAKIEELSKYVAIDTTLETNGGVTVRVDGTTLVSQNQVVDTLEAFDAGGGQFLVRSQIGGTTLNLSGGSILGTISARDGALVDLSADLDALAALLVTEVNTVHSAGFGLNGTTGANFFTGTNAATIAVNSTIADNPDLIQASGTNGAVGDNTVAVALAQLADKTHASFNNQTFSQRYGQTVSALGQSIASAINQVADQKLIEDMIKKQRESISGVSIDEEMTQMLMFQRAFQAAARLVTTVDEMLETVINMKR